MQNEKVSRQPYEGDVGGDSVVLEQWFVDAAIDRDESDSLYAKRLRRRRRGLILTVIMSVGSWVLIFYLARLLLQ